MEWLILSAFAAGAWVLFMDTEKPTTKANTTFRQMVRAVLQRNDTGGMNRDLLFTLSDLETGGGFSQKGNATFKATNSLFNRHKGSGRGNWTGRTYNAGPGDEELRIYNDPDQSVKDILQLFDDPLYIPARDYARAGNFAGFFHELARVGYSTQVDYEAALNRRYREVIG